MWHILHRRETFSPPLPRDNFLNIYANTTTVYSYVVLVNEPLSPTTHSGHIFMIATPTVSGQTYTYPSLIESWYLFLPLSFELSIVWSPQVYIIALSQDFSLWNSLIYLYYNDTFCLIMTTEKTLMVHVCNELTYSIKCSFIGPNYGVWHIVLRIRACSLSSLDRFFKFF